MRIRDWYNNHKDLGHIYRSDVKDFETANEIVSSFRDLINNYEVYLYGAGTVGKNYLRLFGEMGICIRGIYDKCIDSSKILNVQINDANSIDEYADDNSLFIVAVNREHYREILSFLTSKGIRSENCINGHDLHLVLQSSWCMLKALDLKGKLDTKDCWECTLLNSQCSSLREYLKKVNGYDGSDYNRTETVRMIGYVLGNVCSLNCKNCCECIPYYKKKNRGFVSSSEVIKDIEKLSKSCEFLTILEFVGGEPFLHPQLDDILKYVLKMNNVGMIHIFTNGTVVPSDKICDIISNERIEIYMSNYQTALSEKLQDKRRKTIEKLLAFDVSIMEGKKEDWLDYRSFDRMTYSRDESLKNFSDCFLHNCNRLYKGTLYTCPHQYAGVNLGVIEPVDGVINVHELSSEQLTVSLDAFKKLETIDACMNCKLPYNAEHAVSGEQL